MNAHIRIDDCEFAPPRLTSADIQEMTRSGVLPEGRGYELVEGVLVRMAAQYNAHVRMLHELMRKLISALPEEFAVAPGPSIFLSETTMLEPDVCIYPASMNSQDVRGPDILLAIEISDTSLRYDLGTKLNLYAAHSVAHYWVVDLTSETLIRHSEPEDGRYRKSERQGFGQEAELPFDPMRNVVI